MTNLELQAAAWHDNTFGPTVDIPATYKKLLEEVGELGEALMHQNPSEIADESGDVILVMVHLVRATCGGKGIIALADAALNKCESRRYLRQGGKNA